MTNLKINENDINAKEITDSSVYSIQMDKLKREEETQESIAERHKQEVRKHIKSLQEEFKDLKDRISDLPSEFRLKDDEMDIDPEFDRIIQNRNKNIIETNKKQLNWKNQYNRLA